MNVNQAFDRTGGLLRSTARWTGRVGRRVGSFADGKARAVTTRSTPKPGMDDLTLKNKVETEIFRDPDSPKGSVSVSVVDGVVELRGEVKRPEIKEAVEAHAGSVPE